ncbi:MULTISPECIES: 2Fe-2S iron-sulfur cluster binding domain-containing protein [unclassified Caballeronia]|uniref:FAD-binding oxidoreductase n=1 Tax=unclassified Caballeronia TaxID=2646786 RepID=UPI001F304C76|nr:MULTISPECIES: 2Fe-2S iron-sulfur cluster binding domain-containing protein [unclassified Caballeronia]MCE4543231.1 2Fe-2S iron-sulfur cluster binding domain-containing protein [Caballeronia sp. PC1]MCE4567714.1 2Fe-2S iron-sulfur cluster binding domain-containing protein [Caballeronia sp. CLC5]
MTFRIDLTTRDAQQLRFDCAPDQDLLTAAATANIVLPSQCRKGSCGACHAVVTHGDFRMGNHSADALSRDQAGAMLMCRTTPCSDLQVSLPYDHTKVLRQPVPRRTTTIVSLDTIARHTVRLVLEISPDAEGGWAAEFEAGQFMELEIPGTDERRPYSLANTSNWEGRLEFMIRLQPDGRFSTFLRERARLGEQIVVRGPLGGFGIREGSLRPRWFVAGGTGVAPMLSMLRRMADFQEIQDARLFFGVNEESELFLEDELKELRPLLPQLSVELCVWRPSDAWQGFRGTPVDALRAALASANAQPDIYVCGPPALIRAAEQLAAASNVPAEQFASERFTSGAAAA